MKLLVPFYVLFPLILSGWLPTMLGPDAQEELETSPHSTHGPWKLRPVANNDGPGGSLTPESSLTWKLSQLE